MILDLETLEAWARRDYWRAVMYAHLKARLAEIAPTGSGAEFGASNGEIMSYCPGVQWELRDYPQHDVLDAASWDRHWDVVVLDQILEHVLRPWEAIEHLCRCTDRVAVIAMPFLIGLHPCPSDCWRITPEMLRNLTEANFRTVEIRSWGHSVANYWHSLYNDTATLMANVSEMEWLGGLLINDESKPFHIWAILEK